MVEKESSNQIVDKKEQPTQSIDGKKKDSAGMDWHRRLGHRSLGYLKCMSQMYPVLRNVKFDQSIQDCEDCIRAKFKHSPHKGQRKRADKPLVIMHTDVLSGLPKSFKHQRKYIVTFIDDY